MNRKIRHIALILSVILAAPACEEKTDWKLNNESLNLLVVEGMITNELKAHTLTLSGTVAGLNDVPSPVRNAVVAISDGANTTRLFETEPGVYTTIPDVRAVFGKVYTLYINDGGKEYTASTYMVPVSNMEPLRYHQIQEKKNWYELDLWESDDPYMMEIDLDWSHYAACDTLPEEKCHARIVYYNVTSIDVNKTFKPDKERVVFPAGTIVYRKKYSLSPPQEAFVRTLMSETEWRGGVFDVQPGNAYTNLSEGAVGYFSASTVVADTNLILPK